MFGSKCDHGNVYSRFQEQSDNVVDCKLKYMGGNYEPQSVMLSDDVSCQYGFPCCILVSRDVIEIQEIGFKKFGMELWRVVGLHQILAGNVIE